jgi:hypothetical protein
MGGAGCGEGVVEERSHNVGRHSGAMRKHRTRNLEMRKKNCAPSLEIPGSARSLSSGGAERRPVGAAPE